MSGGNPVFYERALHDALGLWRSGMSAEVIAEEIGGSPEWWRFIFMLCGDTDDCLMQGRLSVAEIRRLYSDGWKTHEIAAEAGVSVTTIYEALARDPHMAWRRPKEAAAHLVADYDEGLTMNALAWKYGYQDARSIRFAVKKAKEKLNEQRD